MTAAWWRGGVLYQIYPRSFSDSDGDGVGDLRGIRERLDYLEWLGVDGIWLNPVTVSPDADWGYDVADYCDVEPALGTLADVDALVAEAGARGIRVLLDLVPNHTSDRHPWFVDARSSRDARHREWYVWADGDGDGAPPNNWKSVFGGPAWTFDDATQQWYLHNFLPAQPDLDWWNEAVRAAFDEILRFWFARGVAGFRIDVAHAIVKDRELRDNPPGRDVYNMHRPEVHDVLRRFRRIADEFETKPILVGETWVDELDRLAAFYGDGDELHLAMNFPATLAAFGPELRAAVEAWQWALPRDAWPIWAASNHDVVRFPTRWCGDDDAKVRLALVLLLTLRGTPLLYYGDEFGMGQVEIPREELRDPVGKRGWPEERGRDGSRTPMQWTGDGGGGGFTNAGVRPWLRLGDHERRNVAAQRGDDESILNLCRDLIALRRELPELRSGAYEPVPAPDRVWAWRRGETLAVALNLGGRNARLHRVDGTIRIGTRRERDGRPVGDVLELAPWEGVVVQGRAQRSSSA